MVPYPCMRTTLLLLLSLWIPTVSAAEIDENTKLATVFIASYDREGDLIGRGTGFFVDEGIVITNIHVIDGYARYYRIFTTSADGDFDPGCFKDITRSDIKLNLEDDVAYIRVFIDCPHTSVYFAQEDPIIGTDISVYGYPAIGDNFFSSFEMIKTDGKILGEIPAKVKLKEYRGPWLWTNAVIHGGNSGGPIVQDGRVVGIAVAAHINSSGASQDGIFIPVSIIKSGLENANNSTFGYTPQEEQDNAAYNPVEKTIETLRKESNDPFDPPTLDGRIATDKDCANSIGEGAEANGYKGCRCKASYHKNTVGDECVPGATGYVDPYIDLIHSTSTKEANDIRKATSPVVKNSFSDIEEGDFGYEAIVDLKSLGIINGYADGTYRPLGVINRAELLKILMNGFHKHRLRGETGCFPDVTNEWYAEYICAAKRLGWISGYPDGTFRPGNSINRAEAIKIVMNSQSTYKDVQIAMPTDVRKGSWFYEYVAKGIVAGIITSDNRFRAASNLTRTDAAVWIYNGIK